MNLLVPAYRPAVSRKLTVEKQEEHSGLVTEPGVYLDLPAHVYHGSDAASNSMLKHLDPPARLPAYIRAAADEFEETWAMRCGTFVHHAILEPGTPFPSIIEIPKKFPAPADHSQVKSKKVAVGELIDWSANSRFCRDWMEEQIAKGLLPMKEEEIETVNRCIRAISDDADCKRVFRSGIGEVSLFDWINLPSGKRVFGKGRVDWVPAQRSPFGGALVDIKVLTGGSAAPGQFSKIIGDRRYHVAAAYYLKLHNQLHPHDQRRHFLYVLIERDEPNLIATYSLGAASIAAGEHALINSLEVFAECRESGIWPGFPAGFQQIDIPQWEMKKAIQ